MDHGTAARTLMASPSTPQRQILAKGADKRKVVTAPPLAPRKPAGRVKAATQQAVRQQAARSYPQNYPAQAQAPAPARYSQPAPANYYGYYPQQGYYGYQPNYYQGYGYQGWNRGSSAAACPPGRT